MNTHQGQRGPAVTSLLATSARRWTLYLGAGVLTVALEWLVVALKSAVPVSHYLGYQARALPLAMAPLGALILVELIVRSTPFGRERTEPTGERRPGRWVWAPLLLMAACMVLAAVAWATLVSLWVDLDLTVYMPWVMWQDRANNLFVDLPFAIAAGGVAGAVVAIVDRALRPSGPPVYIHYAPQLAMTIGVMCAGLLVLRPLGFKGDFYRTVQLIGFCSFAFALLRMGVGSSANSISRTTHIGTGALWALCAVGWILVPTRLAGMSNGPLAILDANPPLVVEFISELQGNPVMDRGYACGGKASTWPRVADGHKRDVVLITIEALSAEVLASDAVPGPMENLSALTADGALFTRAISPGPATSFGTTAVQLSQSMRCLPVQPDSARPSLFQILGASGYHSELVGGFPFGVRDGRIVPQVQLLEAGLDRVQYAMTEERLLMIDAFDSRVADMAVETIRTAPEDKPLALWIHFMDPHHTYNPPADLRGSRGRGRIARYEEELASTDRELGRVLAQLAESRDGWSPLLLIAGDHGQALDALGPRYHATAVIDDMVRTSLVIAGAGVERRRMGDAVSLLDVPPTVLDLLDAETPASFHGRSLLPLLRGEQLPPVPIRMDMVRRKRLSEAVLLGEYKLIRRLRSRFARIYPVPEVLLLYNLENDPDEKINLADDLPEVVERLRPFLPRESFPYWDEVGEH